MIKHDDYATWASESWSEIVPGQDSALTTAAVRFQMTSRLLAKAQTRQLRAFAYQGITGLEDFRTIALLRRSEAPGLQVSEIADLLRITRGATSNRLERFSDEGLIDRTQNSRDRRSHYVNLTDSGKELADVMYGSVNQAHEHFFGALEPEELATLTVLLHKLLAANELGYPQRQSKSQ